MQLKWVWGGKTYVSRGQIRQDYAAYNDMLFYFQLPWEDTQQSWGGKNVVQLVFEKMTLAAMWKINQICKGFIGKDKGIL